MIKIFTNNLRYFSTIRFPEKYKKSHQITYELRECFSIKNLKEYMEKEKQKILIYGKTETLQFLNQYPVNFNNIESQFLLFVLNFKNLNTYEEMLRFSCVMKLHQYFPRDATKYLEIAKQQQRRLVEKIKRKEIDGVDGINILVQKCYFQLDQLLNKALETIFTNNMSNYQTMISKCISIILKRIQDLNWCQLRKYHSFLSFLCFTYNSNHQQIKNLVQVLTRILVLQLHKLGYDSVPICINLIFQRIIQEMESVDFNTIQNAFQVFQLLPRDFNYKSYKFLLNQIKRRLTKYLLYPQQLPYQRMTLTEINQVRIEYLKVSLNLINCVFFLSNPKSFFFIYDETFMEASYNYFVHILSQYNKKIVKSDYPPILSFAFKLYTYYFFDSKKTQTIKALTKKMTKKIIQSNLLQPILAEMSICNLLNLKTLQRQFNIFTYHNDRIDKIIESNIKKSENKQKNKTYFKSKAFIAQIEQILGHHVNENDLQIKKILLSIIKTNYVDQIETISSFDPDFISHLAFTLQNSTNHHFFRSVTDKIYEIYKNEIVAMAQLYIIYPHKTHRLSIKLINKIWEKSSDFVGIGKILAYQWENITNKQKNFDNSSVVKILNEAVPHLNKQKMSAFSEGELVKLLTMSNYYGVRIKGFASRFINLTLERIINSIINKKQTMSLVKAYFKVCNTLKIELNEELQTLNIFIHRVFSQSLLEQNISLQKYQLLLQAQNCLKNTEKKYSMQLKQRIQSLFNQKKNSLNNNKIQLPVAFNLILSGNLSLNQAGISHLKQSIQQSLIKNEIIPFHLKEASWINLQNKVDFTLHQSYFIKDIILFCMKQIKIQQGPSFYFWCLQITEKLISSHGQDTKCRDIINECLDLTALFSIDSYLLTKIMDFLKRYPHLINEQFNKRVVNALKIPNLNLTNSYLAILQYFNIIYYEFPNDLNVCLKHLSLKIQNLLLDSWEQNLQNTNVVYLNHKIQQITTNSYIYLCSSIKNNNFNANTFKIFNIYMKVYKKYGLKAINRQHNNIKKITLVNYLLQIQDKNVQKPEKRRGFFRKTTEINFFSKTNEVKDQELVENLTQMKIPTFFREEDQDILSQLKKQFKSLKIEKSQNYKKNEDFYSFDFEYEKGVKVFCFLKYKGKQYTIITKNAKTINNFGLLGELKLYEILYKRIFNLQTLYIEPTNIRKDLKQLQKQ